MAEVLGDNERRDLYRKMLNDAVTSESTRKYSFKDFEKKLLGDPELIGKVAGLSLKRGWAIDENDFAERFVPELKAPPAQKQQVTPAMQVAAPVEEKRYTPPPQPLVGSPEYDKQLQNQYGGMSPTLGATFGGAPASFETKEQKKQEQISPVFKAQQLAFEDVPIASEQRKAQRQWAKADKQQQQAALIGSTGAGLKKSRQAESEGTMDRVSANTEAFWEGAKNAGINIFNGLKTVMNAAALNETPMDEDERQYYQQEEFGKMYKASKEAGEDLQNELYRLNVSTDVLNAIDKGDYGKIPEATLQTIGNVGISAISSFLTAGGSMYFQTLPDSYREGVEAIARQKGITPEEVIRSGEDAKMTAQTVAGITSALERAGAGYLSKSIANKGGYKAVRDYLIRNGFGKNVGRATGLGYAGIGESSTEYAQQATQQLGGIAAASEDASQFFKKLPKEFFNEKAAKERLSAGVSGFVGGAGVVGMGRGLKRSFGPGVSLDKFSDNVVNNEIIQNAARDYQDNITKAEQQGKKPDSFNQKQLKKIAENPEAWVRDEIKYIQQTIESNKTLGLDSKVEENSLAKATSLLNQIKAEKKSMEQADIAPAQEAVPVAPEAEVIAPEGGAPMPQKVKILGKDVNMYNDYIPSRPEDVEPDAMYIFNADSRDGIPPLLQDVAYVNKRESNGVKTENWHASISGEDLLKLYPQKAASPNLIAAPEATPVTEEVPFEEVPAETEDELAFLDEMRLTPEEDAARLAQEGIIPAAPVAPAEEVAPEVAPEVTSEVVPAEEAPTPEQRAEYGLEPLRPTYRGASMAEWQEVQNGNKFRSKEGFGENQANVTWVTDNKEYSQQQVDKNDDGVLIEFKPEAIDKSSVESGQQQDNTGVRLGRDLDINDVLRVTDKNGNVIYEAAPVAQAEEVVAAAPAPKGRKKAAPVTPAPAAPEKEEGKKAEAKKEEGKPKPTSESQEAAVEIANAFSDRFGIKVNLIDSKKLQDLLSNSENAKDFFFKVIDKIDVFDSDNIQEAKNFITTVFQTVESAEDAKKAYRKLAVKYHPDKQGSEEVMKHLNDVNDKYQKGTLGAQRTTERPTQASKEQKYREWAERMSRQYEADARAYSQGNAYNAEQQAKESARAQNEKAEREARTKAQQTSGQQAKAGQPKAKPAPAAPISKIKKGIIESLLEFFTKPFGAEKTTKGEVLTFEARSKYKQDAWNKRNSLKEENRKSELNRINENLKNYTNDKITTKQYRDNEAAIRSEYSDKNKAVDNWYDNTVAAIDKAYEKKIPFAYKQYVGDKVAGIYDPVSLQAYVVLDNLDETTFVHEAFSHPFIEALRERNNELYNNLLAESKSTKEIVDYVNETYGNAPQTVKDAEYIARAIDLDANGKLKNKSLIEYIRQFWNEASKIVKDIFGGQDVKIENIGPKTKISDIVDFVLTSGAKLDLSKAEGEFTSKQESSASQEFDGMKKPSKIKTKSFDGKHGKGAFERMKNITDNFEDIMDGMSGKIKQDCL